MGFLAKLFGGGKAKPEPAKESHGPTPQNAVSPKEESESESDKAWRALVQQGIKNVKAREMGVYRNTRMEMGVFLKKEGRMNDALRYFLEVSYLDLNGPQNDLPQLWMRSDAILAPKVLEWTLAAAVATGVDLPAMEKIFLEVSEKLHSSLKSPMEPAKGWPEVRKALQGVLKEQEAHAAEMAKRQEAREEARAEKRAEKEAAKAQEKEEKRIAKEAAKAEPKLAAPKRSKKAPAQVASDHPALFPGDE